MNTAQMTRDAISRALAAVRLPFRGILSALGGRSDVQLAQGSALNGETLEAAELFQHFGFTSGVPAGSQIIVLPLGGKTAHSVIVATENGAFRVQVESGETCVYNQWGAKITLKKEKIVEVECDHFVLKVREDVEINAGQKVTVNAPETEVTEHLTVRQGITWGGSAKGLDGAAQMQGGLTNSGGTVQSNGITLETHTHSCPDGGTSGPQ